MSFTLSLMSRSLMWCAAAGWQDVQPVCSIGIGKRTSTPDGSTASGSTGLPAPMSETAAFRNRLQQFADRSPANWTAIEMTIMATSCRSVGAERQPVMRNHSATGSQLRPQCATAMSVAQMTRRLQYGSMAFSHSHGSWRCPVHIKSATSVPTRKASADWFTGTVYQDPIVEAPAPARVRSAVVSFEPGSRTNWHHHPLGQTLYVVSGVGRCQSVGGPVRVLRAGDSVWIPPLEKHWHGAAPDHGMVHIAMHEADASGAHVTWLEPVSDADYTRTPEA